MWQPVKGGRSGAVIMRSGGLYRKETDDAEREAATLVWLRAQGMPAAEVVETGPGWLITRELVGRTGAAPWPVEHRLRVIDALAEFTLALHALPAEACPFDRTLTVACREAAAAVAGGSVALDDLDPQREGWSGEQLLRALNDGLGRMLARESPVVTHGDWCLPNVVLDPDRIEVVGILDTARAGRADPYADLALMSRSLSSASLNPQFGPQAAERFLMRCGHRRQDDDKVAFYRLLDEFF